MTIGRILRGGKFPVITPPNVPPKYDWLRDDQGVEVLGKLADQDGWNGEIEVRAMTQTRLAVPEENIELTLI